MYTNTFRHASGAKQDQSINIKYWESIIADQMDVVHDRANIIVEEEDRISKLPDDIIHRILSFLDMKYAIQTSTLSKKWKPIWTSMPYLKLNSQMFSTMPDFSKFVKQALSNRNNRTEVSAVELTFRGRFNQYVVKRIVNYAYSHNVRQLTIIRFSGRSETSYWDGNYNEFSQCLCSAHTLKHLTLTTNEQFRYVGCILKSAWDFPVLETLNLSNVKFRDWDESFNLFSKCVNLKDLTLHRFSMLGLDIFNVCTPKLSSLTITEPYNFPKVFNVVAPQLKNLTASFSTSMNPRSLGVRHIKSYKFLRLSTEGLDSLEKVNLSLPMRLRKEERYAPRLLDLFRKLHNAKFLILDTGIIEALSSCLDQLSHEPCPFNNLKCVEQKDRIPRMPIQVRKYLLESSPSATFIVDLLQVPQKRSRHELDKGTAAKKAPSSCPNQLSHEPSSFNNLKCLNQTDPIPRMPTEIRSHLFESSPSASPIMDLSEVPHKKSRLEADNGTMGNTLEEEKQQTETMDEEKRMLEVKEFRQYEVIAEQKVMLEAMKLQHEKRMLEAKIQEQDKIIAQQKVMLEAMKLQHENIDS